MATAFHFNEVYLRALMYCNCQGYLSIFVRSEVFLAVTVVCWCMMSSSSEPPFWKNMPPLSSQFYEDYGLYDMPLCSLVEKYKQVPPVCYLIFPTWHHIPKTIFPMPFFIFYFQSILMQTRDVIPKLQLLRKTKSSNFAYCTT